MVRGAKPDDSSVPVQLPATFAGPAGVGLAGPGGGDGGDGDTGVGVEANGVSPPQPQVKIATTRHVARTSAHTMRCLAGAILARVPLRQTQTRMPSKSIAPAYFRRLTRSHGLTAAWRSTNYEPRPSIRRLGCGGFLAAKQRGYLRSACRQFYQRRARLLLKGQPQALFKRPRVQALFADLPGAAGIWVECAVLPAPRAEQPLASLLLTIGDNEAASHGSKSPCE